MSDLIYNIHDIFKDGEGGFLKQSNKQYYNIPAYQRGFKWTSAEVEKLLEDIDKFKAEGVEFYCLQNITLVSSDIEYFNVVDGQQRLTTLYILLAYLGKFDLVVRKLRYPKNSIRAKTYEFLESFLKDIETSDIFKQDWNEFIENNNEFNHQDIFYLFSAAKTIIEWFSNKEKTEKNFTKDDFLNKLLHQVKLIVNNIEGAHEEEIFGNLNSKRIPLDGADLVRAILITRVAKEESKRDGVDIKNIVRENERRVRIGWELDNINAWWSKPEVSFYYEKFVSIGTKGDILFQIPKHPINLLLKLYAEKENKNSLSLDIIEQVPDALNLYKDLIKLHHTFTDWHEDREIYHYLGYLFFQKVIKFKEIWQLWSKTSNSRKDFKRLLKDRIKEKIFSEDDFEIVTEEINWYEDRQELLVKILLLLDVISSLNKNQAFLPSKGFAKTYNDIEHIFPQNPKKIQDKKAYIDFLNEYVTQQDPFDLSEFDSRQEEEVYQESMEEFIRNQIVNIDINSIGNLVLLYARLNRSLSNNCYAIKRARIIQYFNEGKDNFIQPHTFRVFVRYFSDMKDLEHWTNDDIQKNAIAIKNTLKEFFKTGNDTDEEQ